MKILILGSMTFSPEMKELGTTLAKKGYEVKLPEFIEDYNNCSTREEMHTKAVENKLRENLYKTYHDLISRTDAILIVNEKKKGIEGYIGANTLVEMGFARALEKRIYLFRKIPEMDYTEEIRATDPIVLNGNLELIK